MLSVCFVCGGGRGRVMLLLAIACVACVAFSSHDGNMITGVFAAPSCVCDISDCDDILPSDCPGLGVVMWDPCKCCKVCARTEGEPCGGVLGFSGTCEPGLDCLPQPGLATEGICQRDLQKV